MNWSSLADFADMGGHAIYVWGSYFMAGAALGWEALMLMQRRRRAVQDLRDQARRAGISVIPLAAPTTGDRRLAAIGERADGFVYCLRATDGALAWRFRAAPEDRRGFRRSGFSPRWPSASRSAGRIGTAEGWIVDPIVPARN